ncbi:hypothetical protein H2199_004899 [Coniosporium tulheliwenetii]|uniref:Uncharacterized protein n=1 Tax=Coniosporium tulheliwenetii TaxID=3383036 RepID=A0ACC2Z4C2_9PEZI|nr:hypothetical protein H2199_004899 [Cladosporium sp. JES 115]
MSQYAIGTMVYVPDWNIPGLDLCGNHPAIIINRLPGDTYSIMMMTTFNGLDAATGALRLGKREENYVPMANRGVFTRDRRPTLQPTADSHWLEKHGFVDASEIHNVESRYLQPLNGQLRRLLAIHRELERKRLMESSSAAPKGMIKTKAEIQATFKAQVAESRAKAHALATGS